MPTTDSATRLAYARYFDSLGLQVVPLFAPTFGPAGGICSCRSGASCQSPGKHPRARYKGQPSRLPTTHENYAVVLGPYVVVDVDDRSLLDRLPEVLGFDLPETWSVDTARGRHLWYKADRPLATRLGARPHVDLKSGTTYVVGPGSVSVTGVVYEPINTLDIAPAPEALVRECGTPRRHVETVLTRPVPRITSRFAMPLVDRWCDEMRASTTRNNDLLRITCAMLRSGVVGEDGIALLADAAREAGLDGDEIGRTQASARRMVTGEP